ncbi:MAG: TetR/AcrR family transcriptional regulator C-terminal domain-containing protein [Piscinibacter sp.]
MLTLLRAHHGGSRGDRHGDATFEARLRGLIHRHLEVFVAEADLCRLFISEVRTATDYQGSPIQQLNRRYTSILMRIVDDGIANGEVRGDIEIRAGARHDLWRDRAFVVAAVNGRPLDVDVTADGLIELIVTG